MWFFIYSCYILSGLSLLLLVMNGIQGYWPFAFFTANHATLAILTIIIYLFTETLVIFYFVGIGVSIKEFVQSKQMDPQYHRRSVAIKRWLYPPILLNMFLIMVLFISGGAVHTGLFPGWIHGLLFYAGILHYLHVIRIQHRAFKESTAVVLDMAGIKPPVAAGS